MNTEQQTPPTVVLSTALLGAERPEFVLELPDGDTRSIKVWSTEKRTDGKWYISVAVDDTPETTALRAEIAELRRKMDAIAVLTL